MTTKIWARVTRVGDNQVKWEVHGETDLDQLYVNMHVMNKEVTADSSYANTYSASGTMAVPAGGVPWSANAKGYPGNQLADVHAILPADQQSQEKSDITPE
jgi:hypothetical protein